MNPDGMRSGSRPWRWDPRERGFSHKRYFGAPDIHQLPREGLRRPRRPVEDQIMTLRCTAYAGAVAQGYIHGLRFHPDWQAKKIGQKQRRHVDEYGADPKAAMSSLRDDGSLLRDMTPISLETHGAPASGQWSAYPDTLDVKAKDFRALAYLGCDDAFDYFDDIRWALFKAYDPVTKKGAIVHAFGQWFSEWTYAPQGIVQEGYTGFTGYHAYLFVDWCTINGKLYLVAQNSAGIGTGDQGFLYFPREIVNREFSRWSTALKILTPMTKEQIENAKREDTIGVIQRLIIQAWWILSEKFGALFGRYAG
jgi:hypothetical protein